jgi:hypothetical protein
MPHWWPNVIAELYSFRLRNKLGYDQFFVSTRWRGCQLNWPPKFSSNLALTRPSGTTGQRGGMSTRTRIAALTVRMTLISLLAFFTMVMEVSTPCYITTSHFAGGYQLTEMRIPAHSLDLPCKFESIIWPVNCMQLTKAKSKCSCFSRSCRSH